MLHFQTNCSVQWNPEEDFMFMSTTQIRHKHYNFSHHACKPYQLVHVLIPLETKWATS